MIYAIIKDGRVVNTALWDGVAPWVPDGQVVKITGNAGIGWTYADGQFVAPPEPEPVAPVAPVAPVMPTP